MQNLNSVKGLDLTTIATFIPETTGFEFFNILAQVVSYTSYDVSKNQSGNRTSNQRLSKKEIAGSEGSYPYPLLASSGII